MYETKEKAKYTYLLNIRNVCPTFNMERHFCQKCVKFTHDYEKICLIRSLKMFIFRYQDLIAIYSVSAEKIINDGGKL
jgi:RNA polymerase subunit RPABC4/transcription elongation factor Spt4